MRSVVGPASWSGRETIGSAKQVGFAWFALLIAVSLKTRVERSDAGLET